MYKAIFLSVFVLSMVSCGTSKSYDKSAASNIEDPQTNDSPYQCDGRQYCSEMDSYEEAKYFLDNCPDVKMDGDHDGIPCERQFNR